MSFEGGIRVCGHFEAAWPRARSRSNFAHTNARALITRGDASPVYTTLRRA